jgi:NAD(P)-dependent dehydrogenase (short-subunit alcohol dehydrogenase family)
LSPSTKQRGPKGDLEGRVALVTGAAKGIGLASATALATQGARVVFADSDQKAGNVAVKELVASGTEALFVKGDVSSAADAKRIVATAKRKFGDVSILVNSAGIQRYGNVVDTPEEQWDEVLGVNLKGVFLMSKFAVPSIMAAGGGTIVNVASVQALAAQRGVAAYSASKGGVVALTRAMAVDFAPDIRVNAILPGSVDTPMLREAAALFSENPEQAIIQWGAMHPMDRVAKPSEVGEVVAFLAGPRSSFVTGASLLVDGGLLSVIGGT